MSEVEGGLLRLEYPPDTPWRGRNNWLFLGHPRAASGRLQLFSIASSAPRHHLVMQDYLEDVLQKLADAKQNHPADLELGSPYLLELLKDSY